jgi:hypothetical protein
MSSAKGSWVVCMKVTFARPRNDAKMSFYFGAAMRKLVLGGLVAGVFVNGVNVVDAAYVIRLKNGNEYTTGRYWQEGTQVLFDTYGGIFGVDKAFILKIEKSDKTVRFTPLSDRHVSELSQSSSDKSDKESAESKPLSQAKIHERDPDDRVVSEYKRLNEKSKEVDAMLTSEIRELLKEITAFKNKLSRDSKLFVEYGREFNDSHEIGATVENALRSRAQ